MAGGGFTATAYGPPWNAMNGSGVTSTGVALRGQVPVIAVDPSVIPYGSIVRVSNSPLGQNKLFVAADTGGAIKGKHIDFYVASGRGAQNGWGVKNVQLQMVKPGGGPGSVRQALSQVTGGAIPQGAVPQPPGQSAGLTQVPVTTQGFDQAGFQQAKDRFIAGSFLAQTAKADAWGSGKGLGPNPLLSGGLLTTTAPNPANYATSQTRMQQVATGALQNLAGTPLSLHPALRAGTMAGGFLPHGATYIPGRKDQGRDGQTNPGGPIIANGDGQVVNVLSDPNGFGPRYPVVHFTSGQYAGRTIYFGHTLAVVRRGQQVKAGQVLSRTGTSGVGNATVPGWFEIGFADSGAPGPMGQPAPF